MATSQKAIIGYIGSFLDYCEVEKGHSDNTQKNYRGYLNLFVTWLKSTKQEKLRPAELTAQHVWDYRLYLARGIGCGPARPCRRSHRTSI